MKYNVTDFTKLKVVYTINVLEGFARENFFKKTSPHPLIINNSEMKLIVALAAIFVLVVDVSSSKYCNFIFFIIFI